VEAVEWPDEAEGLPPPQADKATANARRGRIRSRRTGGRLEHPVPAGSAAVAAPTSRSAIDLPGRLSFDDMSHRVGALPKG
jgi:hypothetical protein